MANSGESLSRAMGKGFEARAATSRAPAAAAPAKHTIVQLPPAQTAEWANAISPVNRRMDRATSGRDRVARHLSQADRRGHCRQLAIEAKRTPVCPRAAGM